MFVIKTIQMKPASHINPLGLRALGLCEYFFVVLGADCEASCHSLSVGAGLTAHHLGTHTTTTSFTEQATASSTSNVPSPSLFVSPSHIPFCLVLFWT